MHVSALILDEDQFCFLTSILAIIQKFIIAEFCYYKLLYNFSYRKLLADQENIL